ncbi:hypothetical protein [Microbacterium sp.]|uniref:hypothetical protein n=1 Tax=Microbacterium sp. TaxID=51671 RepID=UPI003A86CCEB
MNRQRKSPDIPRRSLAATVLLGAVLAAGACAPLAPAASQPATPPPSADAADSSTPRTGETPGDQNVATEVDPYAPVVVADGRVETACYVFSLPAPDWSVQDGSEGCLAVVAFGNDMLSSVRVTAAVAPDGVESLRAFLVEANEGTDSRDEVVEIAGRDVVRVVTPLPGGFEVATWAFPVAEWGVAADGRALNTAVVSTVYSDQFESFVTTIIGSMTRADGTSL